MGFDYNCEKGKKQAALEMSSRVTLVLDISVHY
jgi:hypothetical protein